MLTPQQVLEFGNQRQWKAYVGPLRAQHPDLMEYLRERYQGKSHAEAIWLYVNQTGQPACRECSAPARFRNVKAGYSQFCGNPECSRSHRNKHSGKARALKEQPEHPPLCANPGCDVPVKKNQSGLWAAHCSRACRGQHNSLKSRDRARATWQNTLGTDHPRRCPEINQRLRSSWMETHGVDNPAKVPEIAARGAKTRMQRYGRIGNNPSQLNPNLEILQHQDRLSELYPQHSPQEIAAQLGVHVFTVYRYLHKHGLVEPYRSSFEKSVIDYLEGIGVEMIEHNNRRLLNGRELDIWLPDCKVAIECHGVYWHHDGVPHIDAGYHQRKFLDCERLGIQLLSLFSDQWVHRRGAVERMLLTKLGKDPNRVGARECEVREIPNKHLRPLLEAYHIQGFAAARHAVGLFYQNQLVAGMSFAPPRLGIGKHQKPEGVWELVRAVSGTCVQGGASRMLSHFVRTHRPSQVYSYSDNEWSTGDLYRQLGFDLEREVAPGYWYVSPDCGVRQHRFRFAKHRLVSEGYDPDLTEREIMANRGYLRVWDCGKRLWVKNL